MKRNFSHKILLLLISLIINVLVLGQTPNNILTDSIAHKSNTIKISDISIISAEVMTEMQRLRESLISDNKIEYRKANNDSILLLVDSVLVTDRAIDMELRNTRFLSNKLVYWKKTADVLNSEKANLAYEINILNEYKANINEDIILWNNTKSIIEQKELESTLLKRVDQLLVVLDSMNYIIIQKSDALLISLNNTTEESVIVSELINKIDQTYINKKKDIFVQNEPSLFSLDYSDKSKTSIREPIIYFYNMEVKGFLDFLKQHIPNTIVQIVLLILLIVAFLSIKRKLQSVDIEKESFYRRIFSQIMSQSISAALIVGVFTSAMVFTDRPELLKDFLILCITVPVIIIAKIFINKKMHFYVYLFGVVIVLNIIYIVFPSDNLYYFVILLIAAFIEIFILWKLIKYFRHNPYPKEIVNWLIVLILYANLGFALAGLSGLLYGSTTLAEVAINIPVANTFTGLLFFSIIVIINGFVSFVIESTYALKMNVVRLYGNTIKKWIISIVNLILIILWVLNLMTLINIKRPFIDAVTAMFTAEISIGSAGFTLGNVAMFFFVIWLSVVISKIIRILLEEDILNNLHLAKGVPHTIAVMVKYSLVTLGVLFAITAAGMPLSSLTVMAGAFSVGIGFGLQNIFNNIVSGFILLFERPIQLGDTIEVGQLIGKVRSIGIRSSNVRTFEGADVIVPNGLLISNEVVNWTLSDQRRRIEVLAGVAYGSDPHKVKELFEKVLDNHEDILTDPKPSVLFQGLGESSLDFRLLFWTSNYPEWIRIRSDIVFGVHDILVNEGISIPFPQMDLHLKSVDNGINLSDKITK